MPYVPPCTTRASRLSMNTLWPCATMHTDGDGFVKSLHARCQTTAVACTCACFIFPHVSGEHLGDFQATHLLFGRHYVYIIVSSVVNGHDMPSLLGEPTTPHSRCHHMPSAFGVRTKLGNVVICHPRLGFLGVPIGLFCCDRVGWWGLRPHHFLNQLRAGVECDQDALDPSSETF